MLKIRNKKQFLYNKYLIQFYTCIEHLNEIKVEEIGLEDAPVKI